MAGRVDSHFVKEANCLIYWGKEKYSPFRICINAVLFFLCFIESNIVPFLHMRAKQIKKSVEKWHFSFFSFQTTNSERHWIQSCHGVWIEFILNYFIKKKTQRSYAFSQRSLRYLSQDSKRLPQSYSSWFTLHRPLLIKIIKLIPFLRQYIWNIKPVQNSSIPDIRRFSPSFLLLLSFN